MNLNFITEYRYLIYVCILAGLLVMPIAYFGIPHTFDLPQHFRFAQVYYDAMMTGNGFAGWAGNENFGYGDIGIRFYPPLAYYVLAIARIFVGNWYDATWLTFVFWMILGCIGIYTWARCWFDAKESAIAAAIYLVVPYHLHQLYTGYNNFSEFAATSLLTFCLAYLTKIFQSGKLSDVLWLSVFYALLILTHLPLSLIGSICLAVYSIILCRKDSFYQPIIKAIIGGLIGVGASSFYWIRMITEIKWLNHATDKFSSEFYDFSRNFYPIQYFARNSADKGHNLSNDVLMTLTLLFLLSSAIYYFHKKNQYHIEQIKNIYYSVLPLGIFAFFMFTPLSYPLWKIITPLQKVQFPVRWMPVVAMCGAIIATSSLIYLMRGGLLKRKVWTYTLIIFSATVLLYNFTYIVMPSSFIPLNREKFEATIADLRTEQSFDCWWTVWSNEKAFDVKEKVLSDNRSVNIISWSPEEVSFEVSSGRDSILRIAKFYYPYWQATINGEKIEIQKDEMGVMLIPISSESASVKIYFQEPLLLKIASIFSIMIWLSIAVSMILLKKRKTFLSNINFPPASTDQLQLT
jgi:uncharacterized membrane protein